MIESRRSAVIVPLELPPRLELIRQVGDHLAGLGVPAHVTLLFPFLEPDRIKRGAVANLRRIVRAEPPFEVDLSWVRAFPASGDSTGTLYLAPEPPEPFVRLTRAIWGAYPDHAPYEGQFEDLVPHLTLAKDASRFREVERIARMERPIRRRVTEAWLIVEGDDDRWSRRARLPLGRDAGPG